MPDVVTEQLLLDTIVRAFYWPAPPPQQASPAEVCGDDSPHERDDVRSRPRGGG